MKRCDCKYICQDETYRTPGCRFADSMRSKEKGWVMANKHALLLLLMASCSSPPLIVPVGAVRPGCDTSEICDPAFRTSAFRHTTSEMKGRACIEFHATLRCPDWDNYEIDHFIPLELCGADVQANLWPEPQPKASVEDELENYLHDQVCQGTLTLDAAQQTIMKDKARNGE